MLRRYRMIGRRTILCLTWAAALAGVASVLPAIGQEAKPPANASPGSDAFAPERVAGTYAAHLTGDFVVALEGGRLFLRLPLMPSAPLISRGGGRYEADHPQLKGWSATFRPGSFSPDTIEMHIVQPEGQGVFPRRTTEPLERDLGEYSGLIGHYTAGKDKAEILNLMGRLALYEHGSPAFPLKTAGRDVFIMTSAPGTGEFRVVVRREGGDVLGFVLRQPDRTSEYLKAGAIQPVTSEQLRQKIIEALGGEAALKAKRTLVEEYELDLSGVTGTAKTRWRAPLSNVSEISFVVPADKSRFTARSVFDGTKGSMISTGKPAKRHAQSDIDWEMIGSPHEPLLWSRLYKSVVVLGPRRFDERDAIAVVKTLQSGRAVTAYYDATTYLPMGVEGLKTNEGGREERAIQVQRDWRMVGGVRRPFTVLVREGE
ncbi:MAG TPA: hypothetical protein PK264_21930, partial [Hyphomicrobiaceae bacterium]|nr:hypothetical protein [Hyphomicrobiaceae bacterium]